MIFQAENDPAAAIASYRKSIAVEPDHVQAHVNLGINLLLTGEFAEGWAEFELLNRFDPDWRWLLGRDDSPWYPSLRRFRQARYGEWDDVVAALRAALPAFAGERTVG